MIEVTQTFGDVHAISDSSRRDPKVKGVKRFFRIPPGGIRKSNESNASAAQLIRYGMPQGCFGGPRGQACFAEFSFDFGLLWLFTLSEDFDPPKIIINFKEGLIFFKCDKNLHNLEFTS